jgi:DNA-directed RNA polymerase specialized sigma subunit
MSRRQEYEYAELPVDKLILESFANNQSAYYKGEKERSETSHLSRFRNRLMWHINNSLSNRQKQVMRAFLAGQKQRETARELGVTQQVVNIYKQRAIKRLHRLLAG